MKTLLALFLVGVSTLLHGQLETLPEINSSGRVLKNAKIMKVKPTGLQILHDAGMETVPWVYLPAELQAKYRTPETMEKAADVAAVEAGQKAKNAEAARAVAREKEILRLHELTEQPVGLVSKAVDTRDWCLAHPEGGTARTPQGEITLTKRDRDDSLAAAMEVINYRPAKAMPAVAQVPASTVVPVPEAGTGGSVIESRIDGEFEGWEGETVVKLMNGQVWQQTGFRYEYRYAYSPKVLIYRASGGWEMKVDGMREAVRVQLLR